MARKPPPPETRFKPGQSGNPGGGKTLPPELKNFRRMKYEEFLDRLQKLGGLTRIEFKKQAEDPNQTMFQGMFAKMLLQAHDGDRHARTEILERLWGKVKEVHEIQGPDNFQESIKAMSKEKQEQLIDLLREASQNEQAG